MRATHCVALTGLRTIQDFVNSSQPVQQLRVDAMAARARRHVSAAKRSRSPSQPPAAGTQHVELSFEFGGPVGACATMLALPCVIVGLYAACGDAGDKPGGCIAVTDAGGFLAALRAGLGNTEELFSPWALKVVASWILLQAALERMLPAEVVAGVRLADGSRLRYRMNALLAFWVSVAFLCHAYPQETTRPGWMRLGPFPLAVIYDEYLHLAIAAITIAVALSVYLYLSSFGAAEHNGVTRLLASGGQTGWRVYDFFMGRELNPRACNHSVACKSGAPLFLANSTSNSDWHPSQGLVAPMALT